jgi:hypothetical protein
LKCLKKISLVTVAVAIISAVCSIVIAGLDYIYQGILYSYYLENTLCVEYQRVVLRVRN